MLNTSVIPARNLQKYYKSTIEKVKAKKEVVILTTSGKPQAAIISLEDLEELKRAKSRTADLEMLKLATESKKELSSLPANLRDKASEILYGKND